MSINPVKKPLWWVLPCWVCGSQCVQKDRNHPSMLLKFSKKSWERTKSSLGLQELKQRKEPKRRKVLNLKAFKCFMMVQAVQTLIWGCAGFAVFREGKEICGGFETIPLGSNNIGEFTGCLKGMQCARSMTNEIEVVGDCMILTKAAPKTHAIKNYTLNELLCEIHKLAMCFDEIEFIHILLRT